MRQIYRSKKRAFLLAPLLTLKRDTRRCGQLVGTQPPVGTHPGSRARPPPDTGAVLRGHAPPRARLLIWQRTGACSGGTPPCTPPHMKCTLPPGFHMHSRVRSGVWSGAVGAPPPRQAVEPSTEPQARADAPAASYGMTVASPCRSPRTRRARPPRSAAAKGSGWLTTAFCRLSGGRVHVVWSVACT